MSDGNTVGWYRPGIGVTGALNVSNWADQSGNGNDLVQATGANQPIYLPFVGTKYGYLPGVASNYFATPDSVANSITGPIDIRVRVALNDWTPAAQQILICKDDTNTNRCWVFQVATTGKLQLVSSSDGLSLAGTVSTAAPVLTDGTTYWLRATQDATTTTYYTAADSESVPTSWTQLGNTVSAGSASIFDGNAEITLGMLGNHSTQPAIGKFYRAQLYNGINGTLVNDFNPGLSAETSTNGATFTAATGEVWTLNSTGTLPAQIVGSPSFLSGGTSRYFQTAAATINPPYTIISVERAITWTSGDVSFDGRTANSFAAQQITGTPQMKMWDGTTASASVSPTLGTYYIVTASQAADGTTSVQLNAGTPATGTLNATGLAGLTAFADGAGANFWNGQKKEMIVLSEVASAAKLLTIQQRVAALHGISL